MGCPSPRVLHGGDKPPGCWENYWNRENWRSLDFTCEEYMGAGLPINRVERALHQWLLAHYISQSEQEEHPSPTHSTSQLGTRSGADTSWEKTQSRDTEMA